MPIHYADLLYKHSKVLGLLDLKSNIRQKKTVEGADNIKIITGKNIVGDMILYRQHNRSKPTETFVQKAQDPSKTITFYELMLPSLVAIPWNMDSDSSESSFGASVLIFINSVLRHLHIFFNTKPDIVIARPFHSLSMVLHKKQDFLTMFTLFPGAGSEQQNCTIKQVLHDEDKDFI
ncbi:hypothetical protein VNO78_26495 [Psophocarpus tetragonolobus]|uniref:Uncharacterized protein n=1 Tax=Psophocarpus tetragonolobus TaxID=3891 RepID=A0AAN9S226_PSOTE